MSGARPLTVMFVKDHLAFTGGTSYLLRTLPHLDPAQVRPVVCGLREAHPIGEAFGGIGVPPIFLGRPKWDWRAACDLLRQVEAHDVDLLHLEGAKTFIIGRLVARAKGIPALLHFHNMLPMPAGIGSLQRRLSSSVAAALAVSRAVQQWAVREFRLAEEQVEVLYNSFEPAGFANSNREAGQRVRAELALADQAPVIGLVGRIDVAVKGQDLMIRAFEQIRARHPGAILLMVGDGPDRASCEALAAELGLGDAVVFTGHRSDVPSILSAVDVVALPSVVDEGYPYAALEASAAGRPVVGFDSGGLAEVIEHEVSGLVVEKGDAPALVRAVGRLLDDPALAGRFGDQGRKRAAGFSADRHVERLHAIYQQIATSRG